jgi:LmbE family N-acetylglucosaminyl deacetylase
LGLPDGGFFDEEARLMVVEALRLAQPEVVLTHALEDAHPDHGFVAREVITASYVAALPHVVTDTAALAAAPVVYQVDPLSGLGFLPEEYVDVGKTFKQKLELVACHHTQLRWHELHENADLLDFIETVNHYRGLQCGMLYAEGFRVYRAWPRVAAERLLP